MNIPEEIRIKMAKREGWRGISAIDCGLRPTGKGDNTWTVETLPTYDNDSDLDRYIRGMSGEMQFQYAKTLRSVVGIENEGWQSVEPLLIATPEQKLAAIIKAERALEERSEG